jgi:hypothetical protein
VVWVCGAVYIEAADAHEGDGSRSMASLHLRLQLHCSTSQLLSNRAKLKKKDR